MRRLVSILLFVLSFSSLVNAENGERILVLHSYTGNLSWTEEQQRGLLSVFEDPDQDMLVSLEYMDTKVVAGEEYFRRFAALLEHKYQNRRVDYIVATDNNALEFLRLYRNQLFGEVPVVFSGVNYYDSSMVAGLTRVTGVAEVIDYYGLFTFIERLHPKLERIVVIHDGTITARGNIREMRRQTEDLDIEIFVDQDPEYNRTEALLEALTPREPVFLISSILNEDGQFMEFADAAAHVRAATDGPVYGAWRFFLGHGIVGGPLIDGEEMGKLAGEILLWVQSGREAATIPVVRRSVTRWWFDFEELRRFNIRASLLPPSARFVNQPFPALREQPVTVSVTITAFALLLLLLLLLGFNIRTRKKTEERLTAALQAKTVLLREVHHRVKNNLQIVSSLLSIQQNQIEDAQSALILQDFENRVHSIALVHEQLYRSEGMATVAVEPYLRDLLSRVGESYMDFGRIPRLELQIDETELSIDQTLLLGLVVNEATSNSYKHAFRRGEPGQVEVDLRSEDGFVEVAIRDNGLGFEPPEELGAAESMGIQLMASLADQLKGTIVIDGSKGTVVALRFPILRPAT